MVVRDNHNYAFHSNRTNILTVTVGMLAWLEWLVGMLARLEWNAPFLPFPPPAFIILANAQKGSGAETTLSLSSFTLWAQYNVLLFCIILDLQILYCDGINCMVKQLALSLYAHY